MEKKIVVSKEKELNISEVTTMRGHGPDAEKGQAGRG